MQAVPQQFIDFKRARPISHGGLKLFFAIFVLVGAILGIVFSAIVAIKANDPSIFFLSRTLMFCGALGIGIFALWTLFSFMRFDPTWPGNWLQDYWRNNVVGQDVCIHLTKDEKYCVHTMIRNTRFTSNNCNEFTEANRFFIRLNLGGWFNQSHSLFKEIHNDVQVKSFWNIKLHRLTPVFQQITIWVQDGRKNKLRLDAKILLQVIAHHNSKRGEHTGDLIVVLRHLLDYSHRKYGQWQDEQTRANDLNGKLESAFDIIFDSSQALKDTSRVGKSIEGKVIREEMETRLLGLLPEKDSRRKVLKPQPQTS